MLTKIYLVIGRTGEYSDRSEWPVCWRESLSDAEQIVAKLNAEAAAFKEWDDDAERYSGDAERNERMKAMTDPSFSCDYTGTTYSTWAVEREPVRS
jgi:hypothetical protein